MYIRIKWIYLESNAYEVSIAYVESNAYTESNAYRNYMRMLNAKNAACR